MKVIINGKTKDRYTKVFIKGKYDKNDIVSFYFDLKDIHDKYLYKMFEEQGRIDSEEPFKATKSRM